MNKHKDSIISEEWKKIAKKDWERVKRQLADGDAEAGGYFLQQSLEKYLKAFLLKQGWKLRKIHALHDLLSDAVSYKPELERFRNLCERVSGYYFAERYPPLVDSELKCDDIERGRRVHKGYVWCKFMKNIPLFEKQRSKNFILNTIL